MATKTHTIWPVSYIDDDGKQTDTTYTFDPSNVRDDYWVGEPIEVTVDHPELGEEHRKAMIADLEARLAKLNGAE